MTKPTRGRETTAQRTARFSAAMEFQRAPHKPKIGLFDPLPIKPKRDRSARNAKQRALKSEAEVKREIIEWLLTRDDVSIVHVFNSGLAVEGHARVHYNLLYKHKGLPNMRLPDMQWTRQGIDPILYICEVKHEGWKGPIPSDTRACEQANYLYHMRDLGHTAFFAQSLQDVKDKMP